MLYVFILLIIYKNKFIIKYQKYNINNINCESN